MRPCTRDAGLPSESAHMCRLPHSHWLRMCLHRSRSALPFWGACPLHMHRCVRASAHAGTLTTRTRALVRTQTCVTAPARLRAQRSKAHVRTHTRRWVPRCLASLAWVALRSHATSWRTASSAATPSTPPSTGLTPRSCRAPTLSRTSLRPSLAAGGCKRAFTSWVSLVFMARALQTSLMVMCLIVCVQHQLRLPDTR